jgi:homoserine trans-succinylase
MKITFGIEGGDWYTGKPIVRLPYENVNYWSRVMISLRKHDETMDTFYKRINDEWGLRVIQDSVGITGVELDDSTLSMLLLKYPTK